MHTISLPALCLYLILLILQSLALETVFFREPKTTLGRTHTTHPQKTHLVFPPMPRQHQEQEESAGNRLALPAPSRSSNTLYTILIFPFSFLIAIITRMSFII